MLNEMKKYIAVLSMSVSIIAGILAIYVFFKGEKRGFSYEVISYTKFGTLTGQSWDNLKFILGNKEIKNGGILNIKLKNTGNSSIYPKEFDGPIVITPGQEASFLEAKLSNSVPENLKPDIDINNNEILVAPTLFNPNDEVIIQVVGSGELRAVQVNGRIGGVKQLSNIGASENQHNKTFSWLLLFWGVLCLTGYWLLDPPVSFLFYKKLETQMLSQSGAVLLFLISFLSGSVSLTFFMIFNGISSFWKAFGVFVSCIIISGFVSIPFKYNKQTNSQS